MILLVTVFVLVIACANVANLTLAARAARARDGDSRRARRARLLLRRQLLAENLVLSIVGGRSDLGWRSPGSTC